MKVLHCHTFLSCGWLQVKESEVILKSAHYQCAFTSPAWMRQELFLKLVTFSRYQRIQYYEETQKELFQFFSSMKVKYLTVGVCAILINHTIYELLTTPPKNSRGDHASSFILLPEFLSNFLSVKEMTLCIISSVREVSPLQYGSTVIDYKMVNSTWQSESIILFHFTFFKQYFNIFSQFLIFPISCQMCICIST